MDGPLDPQLLLEVTQRAKKQIRARMKAVRSGHSEKSLSARSERLVTLLLEQQAVQDARAIASFWPMEGRGEIDLRGLHTVLRQRGVELYYPFMDHKPGGGFTTGFRRARETSELEDRGQGFKEPPTEAPTAERGQIDLVLVPALAADARGMRIGYGAGYYDATLGDLCPPAKSWILAYQFQLLAELPAEAHDRACDRVVTDERCYQVDH